MKLLDKFREMMTMIEHLDDAVKEINSDDLPSTQYKLVLRLSDILTETREKIEYYLNNGIVEATYEKLLYTYVWLRSELELSAKLLNQGLKLQ